MEKHILSLLYHYDCVIIPGFGGFVANYAPAVINSSSHMAFPPSKNIIFNKNLLTNDGLLAEQVSREEKISYAEASSKINAFAQFCREKLNHGERIELDELGILYYDNEKNIQFKPGFSANFLVESFGLMPVAAYEIVRVSEEKKPDAKVIELNSRKTDESEITRKKETETRVVELPRKNFARRYWPAAAVLLPIAFYSVWIPVKTDALKTGYLELSDFNPFSVSDQPGYEKRNSAFVFTAEKEKDEWKELLSAKSAGLFTIPVDENTYVVNEVLIAAESTYVHHNTFENRSSYNLHIIGGCFREPTNADNLVSLLKAEGYDAYILDIQNGLHRVAISSHDEMGEALAALKSIRSKGNKAAWLLEK